MLNCGVVITFIEKLKLIFSHYFYSNNTNLEDTLLSNMENWEKTILGHNKRTSFLWYKHWQTPHNFDMTTSPYDSN